MNKNKYPGEKPMAELMSEGISSKSMLQRQKQIMNVEHQIKLLFVKKNEEYRSEKLEIIQKQIDGRMWKWRRVKYLYKIKPGADIIFHPAEIGARILAWSYMLKVRSVKRKLDKQIKEVAEKLVKKYVNDPGRPSDSEMSNIIVDHAHEQLANKMNISQSVLIEMMNVAYETVAL